MTKRVLKMLRTTQLPNYTEMHRQFLLIIRHVGSSKKESKGFRYLAGVGVQPAILYGGHRL